MRVDPFLRAVLAAALVHCAVIGTVLRSVRPEHQPDSAAEPQTVATELVDIDTPSTRADSYEPPTEADVMIADRVAHSRPRSRSVPGRGLRSGFHDSPSAEDPAQTVGLAGSPTEAAVEAPSLSLDQLGIEGPNRLALRRFEKEPSSSTERVAAAEPVVLPTPGGGVSLVRTDIDLVDLGAKARQVVHAYTLDETLFD